MEWEYKTLPVRILTKSVVENGQIFLDPDLSEETEAQLKMLGDQGWELLSVMPIARVTFFGSAATRNGLAFFKRQKDNT